MPSQNKTPPSGDCQRERREFFRIDDRIGLEVRRLDDAHPGDDPSGGQTFNEGTAR